MDAAALAQLLAAVAPMVLVAPLVLLCASKRKKDDADTAAPPPIPQLKDVGLMDDYPDERGKPAEKALCVPLATNIKTTYTRDQMEAMDWTWLPRENHKVYKDMFFTQEAINALVACRASYGPNITEQLMLRWLRSDGAVMPCGDKNADQKSWAVFLMARERLMEEMDQLEFEGASDRRVREAFMRFVWICQNCRTHFLGTHVYTENEKSVMLARWNVKYDHERRLLEKVKDYRNNMRARVDGQLANEKKRMPLT